MTHQLHESLRVGLRGLALLGVAACAAPAERGQSHNYDLQLTHPAPHANYIQVSLADGAGALPMPQSILTPSFSIYLRQQTGCVVDGSRPSAVLGNRAVPAGYMVAVVCP